MIFKQLPTMISDLNKFGIALKALDTMKLGTVGVNVANVEAYRTALKGLSVEQSVFTLASKGATEEQIRQILVINEATAEDVEAAMAKAGLTTATKALTQAEMVEIATKTGVAKAEAEELLRKIGITATEEGQVVVKKQVTLAMLKQAVASGKITAAESAQIATMLGLNAVESTNIGITNVLTASFVKLWAVITAHPIGAILTAIGAVAVGTIAYINKANKDAKKALVEAHETAEQALEDTKTSLSDDKSELQSINSELETTKQKIQEISSIGAPTLAEQNELNKLSTANAQLETQRSLLENNIKLKQKSAALDAKSLLGTQVEMEYSDILDGSSIVSHTESYSYKDHAKYQASNLKNAYNIYMKALRNGDTKKQQLAQELIDASAGDSAVLTSELLEIIESFKYDDGTIIEGYENLYNEYMDMIYNLQSLTNPDIFLDIAKSVTSNTGIDYEKVISDAYKLAYEGNFDIDKLDQDFVKALSDAGIDESTINYIFSLKQQEYQLLVDKINDKYKTSEIQDKITVRQDFWDKDENGKLVAYSVYSEIDVDEEIKKHQEEINEINHTLNDYSKENPIEFQLVSSYDENFEILDKYIEEQRIKAENNTDYVGNYITNAIERIYDEAKVKSSTFNKDALTFNDIFAFKNIDGTLTELGKISESIDTIQKAYNTLSSAIDEYNNNGVISIDTLQSVMELGDDWLDYLVAEDGALKFDKESLDELAKSRLEEMRIRTLNNLVNQVKQIENNAQANQYLKSTNYETAESFEEVARASAIATAELLKAKVASGALSQGFYDAVINKMYSDINKINALFNNASTDLSYKASSAASSAAQSFTDLLDKELNVLDKKMEAGYIDFNDYIKARLDLIEDYYNQGKIKADEYYSYLEKHYKQELSYKDKVIKAVTRRIDKEIDKLEKQKDDIESYYKVQIDALTKQKTLLQDANKERQKQIDLQKAMYELERARNQRTKLIYSEDRGMHYVADEQSIRSAQQEAENAEFEIKIAEIEKAITKLEEARDKETDAIDAMIQKLKDYRDQWNDITSAYEEAQEDLIAQQMLGRDWEKDILDTRLDTLNKFKDDYIAIQQAMVDAAYQAAQAIAKQEKVKIGDSSSGSNNGSGNSKHGWEVVDEEDSSTFKTFSTKKEADDCAEELNKDRARANGIDVSKNDKEWIRKFEGSNIPGYYVKKYHTGLKQGLVDKHSFDDDFKLVQEVGLGEKEVPAILKEGEAVVTPEQVSNLADGIRQSDDAQSQLIKSFTIEQPIVTADGQVLRPIHPGDRAWDMMLKFQPLLDKISKGEIEPGINAMYNHQKQLGEMAKNVMTTNVVNNSNVQQPIVNNINVTLPNVTNSTSAETLMRDLQSLAIKKYQINWK